MNNLINISIKFLAIFSIFFISACGDAFKFRKTDTRSTPVNVEDRVKKNTEEGRGFRLMDMGRKSNTYDFATSNELWRASLSILDFMPLTSADYGGGLIITDWYNDQNSTSESVKISIRFLSNEIRADALKITVFSKECNKSINCKVSQSNPKIENELTVAILKRAAKYKKEMVDSNPKRDLNSIRAAEDRN